MVDKIEEQIRKAMEDGYFNNLPGKGKPLKLDENPFEDPEWHLAFKALKDNDFTLPWIEKRQAIDAELEAARQSLRQAWGWHIQALAAGRDPAFVKAEWSRAERSFREKIAGLNRRIRDYNLEAPLLQFHRLMIKADREIEAIKGA